MGLIGLTDFLYRDVFPIVIYGTKKLDMLPDFICKKVLIMSTLCLLFNSVELDDYLKSIFRPNVHTKTIKKGI